MFEEIPRFIVACHVGVCLVAATPAFAQVTRFDVGGQIASTNVTRPGRHAGVGGWFDVNESELLAAEFKATWFRDANFSGSFHLAAGIKAALLRYPRVSVYGVALPGAYRSDFAHLLFLNPQFPLLATRRPIEFALQLGAGLEVRPPFPLTIRIELNRLIYALPSSEFLEAEGTATPPTPLVNGWDLNVGLTYRAGRALARLPARYSPKQWLFGPQLGFTMASGPVTAGTVGVFASYPSAKYCDFDASLSTFVHGSIPPFAVEGGGITQALAGIKLGIRTGRVGVFFKARTGVNSYSRVVNYDALSENDPAFTRDTVPALDIGGVVEAEVTRQMVLRFDIGETLSFFRGAYHRAGTRSRIYVRGNQYYSLPLRVGVGFRF